MSPEKIAFYCQIGVAIIAIPIIIMVVISLKDKYFTHKGRGDLYQIANNYGLFFDEKPGDEFFNSIYNFNIIESGVSKKAYNVMSGELNGHPVRIFDFVYALMTNIDLTTKIHKSASAPQNCTAFLIEIEDTGIESFQISEKMKDSKLIKTVQGLFIKESADYDLNEKYPDFAKNYSVFCSDEKKLYTIIKPELIQRIKQIPYDMTIAISGKHLLLFARPEFVPVKKMNAFINDSLEITSIIEKR